MHFHLPKPLHGWREFAGEVGIIVIGVLIALGADSLLEDWHWRSQVTQANELFKNELGMAAANAYERLALQDCLAGRLREIATQLNEPGPAWRGMPAHFNGAGRYYFSALPVVYRPPTRTSSTAAWANALTTGTINHLPQDRAKMLAMSYTAAEQFIEDQRQESVAIGKLSPLAEDRTLSSDARLQMLQSVGELDRFNDLLAADSRDFLDDLRAAHLGYADAQVQKARADLLKLQVGYRGSCVKAPPLHLN